MLNSNSLKADINIIVRRESTILILLKGLDYSISALFVLKRFMV
ncbi:conserved hypothetical protein (plasmid) [Borreliella burgdorferi 29805]|nr:hypothetical protein [Borreliella burgdorferi]ACN24213.1 conserved hypothetical protein [Borreliella burgdorferi 64b]ACO38206.1 conserved hypothetical protein [Borreliella burgdorferi 29805]MDO7272928.1 hypothetical protein [Borreliella burgdorferi]MDO7272938.1 hypothetical protein [Borreliella burgdorferi]